MNEKIVFVRTGSGEDEVHSKTAHLSKDIKRALLMVDGTATVAEIMKRSSPSLRSMLDDMFAELVRGGFIQDKAQSARSPKLVKPLSASPKKSVNEVEELDFTAAFRVPTQAALSEEAARQTAKLDEELKRNAEEEHARQQAEAASRLKDEHAATEKAARLAEQRAEKIRAEAQARALAVVEEKNKLEAEVARLKAQAEMEARARAEEHARQQAEATLRLKAEQSAAEAARLDAERQASAAAEAARLAEQRAEKISAEAQARALAVVEEKNKLAAEVARLKAQAEVEAQARAEADGLAKREAEAARIKAEQEASRVREEVELARQRAADEARTRLDAERSAAEAARVQAEMEAARIKAEAEAAEQARTQARTQAEQLARELAAQVKAVQDAALTGPEHEAGQAAHEEANESESADTMPYDDAQTSAEMLASVVRLNAKHAALEESVFAVLDESVKRSAAQATREPWVLREDAAAGAAPPTERRVTAAALPGCDSRGGNNGVPVVERRTTTAAVAFFDIVGYTKQPDSRQLELKQRFSQFLTDSLAPLASGERIILDTGDGAAIGFLQHPTDALESAVHFRASLLANKHDDYLRVRIGIHLGPVSLVKDMNGQINMLGDGINSAQRVMSFAGQNQIYVSRAYFDFVSSLSDEYDDLFRYRGSQQDKHGREHQVYELLNREGAADEMIPLQQDQSPDKLADFNF